MSIGPGTTRQWLRRRTHCLILVTMNLEDMRLFAAVAEHKSFTAGVTSTSFTLARAAVLAGLGIGLFPEFACADDLRRGRLVPVLDRGPIDVGSIWIVHATRPFLSARVRAFVALAEKRFTASRHLDASDRPASR